MYANQALTEPLVLHPKPTGYCYFSNSFGWSPQDRITVNGVSQERQSRWYLAGPITDHAIEVRYVDRLQIIQCELTPMAPLRLFGIAGSDFIGMALPHQKLNPAVQDAAHRCFTSGPEAPREEHVAEANRFFQELARLAQPDDREVTAAIGIFERANGAARVGEVADAIGMNVRTLNRRFTRIVGLSPKSSARFAD